MIPAAMTMVREAAYFWELPLGTNLIPSLWAVHIQGPGDFSGACLAEPELHSPIKTLSNFCTLELTPTIR